MESSSSIPVLPHEQEFHQHLRALVRGAVRVVREEMMCEELDQFIGVAWAQRSPKRKGYRNGFSTRDLVTSSGRLEDIKVPRDREDQFHTHTFERYSRYEPHIAEGLTQMFVAGTSTRYPWEKSRKRCWEWPPVEVTISGLNQTLIHQFEACESVLKSTTGASCTWMTSISVFVMGTKSIRPSF